MTRDYSREILNTEPDRWDLPSYVTPLAVAEGFIFPISLSIIYIYISGRVVDTRAVCVCARVCLLYYILGVPI